MPELGDGEFPNTTAPREHDRGLNVRGSKKAGKQSPAHHQRTLITIITRESDKLVKKTLSFTYCDGYFVLFQSIFEALHFLKCWFLLSKVSSD